MRTSSDLSNGAFTSRGLGLPAASGMYHPRHERDSCGLAMVATTRGTAGHDIVALAHEALRNLEHRGAVGAPAGPRDGAGHRLVVRVGGRTAVSPGEKLTLHAPRPKLHWFDAAGKRIEA